MVTAMATQKSKSIRRGETMRKLLILILLLFLTIPVIAQETEQSPEQLKVKTWRLPADLHQGLVKMVEDFNKEYNSRIEIYKQVLRSSSAEFTDMPEDAVFDLQSGVFLSKNDFMVLQERAKKLQEQAIKDKASGEVKKEAENEGKK